MKPGKLGTGRFPFIRRSNCHSNINTHISIYINIFSCHDCFLLHEPGWGGSFRSLTTEIASRESYDIRIARHDLECGHYLRDMALVRLS